MKMKIYLIKQREVNASLYLKLQDSLPTLPARRMYVSRDITSNCDYFRKQQRPVDFLITMRWKELEFSAVLKMNFRPLSVKLLGHVFEISNFWPSGVSLFRNNHLVTRLTRKALDQSQGSPCKVCSGRSGKIGRVAPPTPQQQLK